MPPVTFRSGLVQRDVRTALATHPDGLTADGLATLCRYGDARSVRWVLHRWGKAGLVTVIATVRGGRGRPANVYALTGKGLELAGGAS
jgi:predicted ArsR family transcriptional regulator